jgi:histidine triad (HIT) family protein
MATIFTRIINGEIPGTFVWRDDVCVAFMSINPLAFGHVLVVPRAEVDHWIDLPVEVNQHLTMVSQRIGEAQQAVFGCERVGVIIAGYEVPHVHVHVIPTTSMSQLSFANAAVSVDRADLDEASAAIIAEMSRRGYSTIGDA